MDGIVFFAILIIKTPYEKIFDINHSILYAVCQL